MSIGCGLQSELEAGEYARHELGCVAGGEGAGVAAPRWFRPPLRPWLRFSPEDQRIATAAGTDQARVPPPNEMECWAMGTGRRSANARLTSPDAGTLRRGTPRRAELRRSRRQLAPPQSEEDRRSAEHTWRSLAEVLRLVGHRALVAVAGRIGQHRQFAGPAVVPRWAGTLSRSNELALSSAVVRSIRNREARSVIRQ